MRLPWIGGISCKHYRDCKCFKEMKRHKVLWIERLNISEMSSSPGKKLDIMRFWWKLEQLYSEVDKIPKTHWKRLRTVYLLMPVSRAASGRLYIKVYCIKKYVCIYMCAYTHICTSVWIGRTQNFGKNFIWVLQRKEQSLTLTGGGGQYFPPMDWGGLMTWASGCEDCRR